MKPRPAGLEDKVFRFGDFRLLPGRQQLLLGEHPVRLGSRALDLLLLMVECPGRLLTKAELVQFAWPDTFVHDDNLKVNIAALRRALTEAGAGMDYIATVPGRGYRFVAPVTVERATPAPEAEAVRPDRGDALPRTPNVIGREDDVARIAGLLDERGFLTIVGPAGVGKTTVALAAARQGVGHFPEAAFFIDFAAIGDPHLVAAAVAAGIGSGGNLKDLLVGIVDALRRRRTLLILDNCEHVLRAASVLAEHIRIAVPETAILATSREPLRCRTETVYRLQPLPYPKAGEAAVCDVAMGFAAVELFTTLASEAAGYRMSDADAPIVADICRRLDGIPLAIELAVPRLRSCNAATLHGLLDRSLESLGFGRANAPLRQQTLLATLDWSYRLLSEDEASVLRLLSVFAGTLALEDAIGVGRHLGRAPEEMMRCIEGLAAKSLLSSSFAGGTPDYRMLDVTRSYATERLRGRGEQRAACAAHAAYLMGIFERAESDWHWRVREDWTSDYGRRANDLRKALDWAFGEKGDPKLGVRLTALAIPLWDELSSVGESGLRVRRALQSPAFAQCDLSQRMKLATAHAWSLTYTESLQPEGESAWLESLRLAEAKGDYDYQLRALWGLAARQCFCGQHRAALATLGRFAAIAERENDWSAVPAGERLRVLSDFYLGKIGAALEEFRRLARTYDTLDRRPRISRFQIDWYVGIRKSLSVTQWVCGHVNEAQATAQAALDAATSIEHVVSQSDTLALAVIPISIWTGQIDAAECHLASLVANLNRRDLAIWKPLARFYAGRIRHERGDRAGVEEMRNALDELIAANFLVRLPMTLSMVAEAALYHGQTNLARDSINAALNHLDRQEEVWCRPEVLRVTGLVQWHDGNAPAAEQTLLHAVEAARESGALSFELRAVVTLAEGWIGTGRCTAAAELLDAVIRRFPADTIGADLARARELLQRIFSLRRNVRECGAAAAPSMRGSNRTTGHHPAAVARRG